MSQRLTNTMLDKLKKLKDYVIAHFPLTRKSITFIKTTSWQFASFILLLTLYMSAKMVGFLERRGLIPQRFVTKVGPRLSLWYRQAIAIFEIRRKTSISRIDLIELSLKNMAAKRTRTLVTIGGMTIGISAIVFLVSLGYGLQSLVINRVARLEEMRQADVMTQPGGKVQINDKSLADFKNLPHVQMALPLIAVVGRVSFHDAVSDMAVYGVTSDYLKQSAIKPVEGKIFDSNKMVVEVPASTGQVAGVETENLGSSIYGATIQNAEFVIDPGQWIRIREEPSTTSPILGYTKRTEGQNNCQEVWGNMYVDDKGRGKMGFDENGKPLGRWVKAQVRLWKQETCDTTKGDCEDGKYVVLRDKDQAQVEKEGYFAEINLSLSGVNISSPNVLGISSDNSATSSNTASTGAMVTGRVSDGSLQFVEIASEAGIVKPPETKTVAISTSALKKAVVNRAMLKVLGINESMAVGKTFSVTLIATGDVVGFKNQGLESEPVTYTVIGVVPSGDAPLFYVPFIDLRSMGISNYSQAKVVVVDVPSLANTRRQIEAMGYITRSVADTVAQINSLFATARTLLAVLGLVALAVAALGMFNTLTVSLLERTREVGLMKAMGMKSSEVQELFLTESMIMGFCGGVLGIVVGFLAGKLIGVILSSFAIFKGAGFVNVSTIPIPFALFVVFLSLLVGVTTGIYPAKRAMRISALDALRYE